MLKKERKQQEPEGKERDRRVVGKLLFGIQFAKREKEVVLYA